MKEGEGISQRTYMYDPYTQTTAWWWPEGKGSKGWVVVGKGEREMGISLIV